MNIMEPATKNDLQLAVSDLNFAMREMRIEIRQELHQEIYVVRKMLEEDLTAVAEEVRSTNRMLAGILKKYEGRFDDYEVRLNILES